MANYNNLLSTINGAIETNGEGAITGQRLQTILDGMVASLGAGYQYMGVATPATNPGTPDENVFYLATQPGTYTNFGGLVVNDGEVCALKWDGAWTKDVTGAATAEQVSQLGQEVNGERNLILTTENTTQHKYINTSGTEGGANAYFYSNPIHLQNGERIDFRCVCDGVSAISLSGQTIAFPLTPVVTTPASATSVDTYSYTATSDCYVVVSGKWSDFEYCKIVSSDSIRWVLTQLTAQVGVNFANSLHSYGTVITAANYQDHLTDLNNAPANTIIVVATGLQSIANTIQDFGAGATIITFYPWKITDPTGALQLVIPSGGSQIYFRNRWGSWNPWQTIPRDTDVQNIKSNVYELQSKIGKASIVASLFCKVLFIGDSLTQGAYYGTPYISKIGRNFPNMFCRIGNVAGANQGYSGINAKDWYEQKSLASYSDYDLIVIWLGTNDGLTDTLETDVNPYTDYHDYADTQTGSYCKIIESIRASNPSANIILMQCFATSGNLSATRTVLPKIAEKYGLPLYETDWLSLANDPSYSYHAGVNNVHLGIFGAWTLASKLWAWLYDYFSTNWIKVENGEQANLNPQNWTYINR